MLLFTKGLAKLVQPGSWGGNLIFRATSFLKSGEACEVTAALHLSIHLLSVCIKVYHLHKWAKITLILKCHESFNSSSAILALWGLIVTILFQHNLLCGTKYRVSLSHNLLRITWKYATFHIWRSVNNLHVQFWKKKNLISYTITCPWEISKKIEASNF